MEAKITIHHDRHDHFGNLMFGAWWWNAHVTGVGSKHGFARTEERARRKAERAARKLATTDADTWTDYRLPLDEEPRP